MPSSFCFDSCEQHYFIFKHLEPAPVEENDAQLRLHVSPFLTRQACRQCLVIIIC